MYKYQNVSEQEQTITSEGDINPRVVKPGETTLSSVGLENPNFKFLGEDVATETQSATDTKQETNLSTEENKVEEQESK